MKRWIQWLLWGALLLAVALGVLRALNARKLQQASAAQAAQALRASAVLSLAASDVLATQTTEMSTGVTLSGALKAVRSAAVKAKVAGELQGLSVREGDSVRAGQLIARIDNTEGLARVRQASEQAEAAQSQVAIAQRQRDNNQALVNQGFISRTALDTSLANLDAALATHKAALAALDIAKKGLADTELRAPITGQVASRLVQNGERVALDTRIVEIVDLSALELEAALAPADALAVRVGQKAELLIEGAALRVPATVVRINPSAQAGSRSVLAYLRLDQADGLRQGLFAQGRLRTGNTQGVAVPLSAVRTDKPQPYLQLVRAGKVVHQTVALGARGQVQDEDWVAVEPLQAGEQVLRVGVGALREGTSVTLASTGAKPQ
ncbi:efflux RND transporter periplasmic adaptor subunit [Hydrogenophaga sp. OTU3427]|uniref:efflux RND transporter periplasmic adaptor subunit n=1 Tax=Hydrogenophaga sp. OTU3427 TaxID=3043856 RepID=UPI00313F2B31